MVLHVLWIVVVAAVDLTKAVHLLLSEAVGTLTTSMFVHAFVCSIRYSAGAHANILWSAGVRDGSEVAEVISRLQAADMPTLDISDMEAARVSISANKQCTTAKLC